MATQVYDFTKEISKYLEINIVKLIGGTSLNSSFELLNTKPHVIIGSPGRILDLMNRRRLITSELKNLVLDEADEILSAVLVKLFIILCVKYQKQHKYVYLVLHYQMKY